MKRWLAACIALLAAAPHAAAFATEEPITLAEFTFGSGQRVVGSGRIVEERRALAGFAAVQLNGPIDVELRASDRDAVTVRSDDNIAPLIDTRVSGGDIPVLEIGIAPGASFRSSHAPVVIVQFRAISALVMRGSGNVRADRLAADDFAVSMSGSGDAHLESLEARRFAAVLAGSGNLTVAGHAAEQAFKLSGSGDVDAARLEGRGVQVAISGSGDASVNASASLDATVAGSGDVVYRGSPRITQRVRGTGSIQKAR